MSAATLASSSSATSTPPWIAHNFSERKSLCKQYIEASLCFMISHSSLPLATTDAEGLRVYTEAIVESAHQLGGHYRDVLDMIPHRKCFTDRVLRECFVETRSALRGALIMPEGDFFSVTSDGWSSSHPTSAGDRFVSLTAHFLDATWTMTCHVLGCRSVEGEHSAANISAFLREVLTEFGLPMEKLLCAVTDNALNSVNAGKKLGALSVRCAAHLLNLVVSDVLDPELAKESVSETKGVIVKARGLVTRYHESKTLQGELTRLEKKNDLPEVLLVGDVRTQWNSSSAMIGRLLAVKEAVKQMTFSESMKLSAAD
jgi:hypothetical protein